MAIWLRRRQAARPALPAGPPLPAQPPAAKPPPAPKRQSTRFVRVAQREPIDIVTVVDDLLGAAH